MKSLSLVVWLLDEKGADVDGTVSGGWSALHYARSLDIVNALLDRGADPILADDDGWLPLINYATQKVDMVARLLQDPRVRATINMQNLDGNTALHRASAGGDPVAAASLVRLLLQAGADPNLTNWSGMTPLALLRKYHHDDHTTIALLEQALADTEKASLLVKVRRLAVAASINIVAPSCLQARVAQDQPFVALAPPVGGQSEEEEEEERKLRTTLALLCGVGREGMPRDVFRVVMDLVVPSKDPLRGKNAGTGAADAELGNEGGGGGGARSEKRPKQGDGGRKKDRCA